MLVDPSRTSKRRYVVGLPPDGLEQEMVALDRHPRRRAAARGCAARPRGARQLSHYKRPARYVRIGRAEVPLSGTAKPQRAALAALAARS